MTNTSTYIAAWLLTTGVTWAFFSRLEALASPLLRSRVRTWIEGSSEQSPFVTQWPTLYAESFDQLFGQRHLSWKCFWRSCVASMISVAILALIDRTINGWEFPPAFVELYASYGEDKWSVEFGTAVYTVVLITFIAVIYNFIADYLSLLETRYALWFLTRQAFWVPIVVLLFVDLIATGLIFWAAVDVINVVFHLRAGEDVAGIINGHFDPQLIAEFWSEAAAFMPVDADTPISMGIFFYSTYTTSVWIWLYLFAGLAARMMALSHRGLNWVKTWLDVENQPIRFLGALACVLLTGAFLLGALPLL